MQRTNHPGELNCSCCRLLDFNLRSWRILEGGHWRCGAGWAGFWHHAASWVGPLRPGISELVSAVLARRGLDSAVLGFPVVRSSVAALFGLGSGFLALHVLRNVTKLRNAIDQRWLFGAVDAQNCDGGHGRF